MGWPVEHSLSPRLHSYWLKKYNVIGSYQAIPIEKPRDLVNALHALKDKNYSGVNLTVPYKEVALKIVDTADAIAKRVGAVNTVIVHNDGKLKGLNTDVYGFTHNLLSANYKADKRAVVILGAGGAARAAVVALLDLGVGSIRILNRSQGKAAALVLEFGPQLSAHTLQDADALRDASLLVNATSLGLKSQPPLDINLEQLPRDALVTDMVYAPLMTDLLKAAEARGNKIVDGLGMLLYQACPAFHAFFGVDPEVTAELRAHVLESRS